MLALQVQPRLPLLVERGLQLLHPLLLLLQAHGVLAAAAAADGARATCRGLCSRSLDPRPASVHRDHNRGGPEEGLSATTVGRDAGRVGVDKGPTLAIVVALPACLMLARQQHPMARLVCKASPVWTWHLAPKDVARASRGTTTIDRRTSPPSAQRGRGPVAPWQRPSRPPPPGPATGTACWSPWRARVHQRAPTPRGHATRQRSCFCMTATTRSPGLEAGAMGQGQEGSTG